MNMNDFVVILLIALIAINGFRMMNRAKKNGKSSCGGNCSNCSVYSSCNRDDKTDTEEIKENKAEDN